MSRIELASEVVGGKVLLANDEFFAPKESLLRATEPEWREGVYTDRGKWMDGWETRRRREPGHDWCIVQLGIPGVVEEVVVDTTHFKGNHPESCAIDAAGGIDDDSPAGIEGGDWVEIVPRTPLQPHARNTLTVREGSRTTHLRLRIYPDGGVARLRVHGRPLPPLERLAPQSGEVELAGMDIGGRVVQVSDDFFSHPDQMLRPGPSRGMFDGWETRRRREPGNEWAIVRLGLPGTPSSAVVDTTHFKGNAPGWISIDLSPDGVEWSEGLATTRVDPDRLHLLRLSNPAPATHVRLNIHPDGGVGRFRMYGTPDPRERVLARLAYLNALFPAEARRFFRSACGATRFEREMEERRPFPSARAALEEAERALDAFTPADWEEAFRAHPRIGERGGGWSNREQAAAAATLRGKEEALAEANRRYEARFGHVFLIFASGRSTDEIMAELEARMGNEPETEVKVAAGEQRKITELRLRRMLCMEEV